MNLKNILPGVALACALGLNSAIAGGVTTNLVSNTSFEPETYNPETGELIAPNGYARWPWSYTYGWGNYTDPGVNPVYNTSFKYPDSDPTNTAEQVYFDTSQYTDPPSDGSGGYGMGFGAGMNWASFDPAVAIMQTNRAKYIMSFDARAEGMLPSVATVPVQMQVQMEAPDDTIQPADSDSNADRLINISKTVNISSNWTHFAYTLDDAEVDGGTPLKNLTLYGNLVNSVNYNVNLDAPSRAFGSDMDNYVYIDNIKLQVIVDTNPPPLVLPTFGKAILDVNFDDKPGWGYYGGYNWSANSYLPLFTYSASTAGVGVGGSSAWTLSMDNSALAAPNTPGWAGGGTGGGGPVDFSLFDTGDLSAYRVTFDSSAAGLAPETIGTTCALQLFLDSPNGNLRLDFAVPAQTNWVTTSYVLTEGNAGDGTSKVSFTTNYNTYTELRTQWQIENAASTAWGFDTDNVLMIDNLKIERMYVGCPPLIITVNGSTMIITWAQPSTGTAKLQSSSDLKGAWADVAGNSPYTIPAASAPKFFRTQWVPPTP